MHFLQNTNPTCKRILSCVALLVYPFVAGLSRSAKKSGGRKCFAIILPVFFYLYINIVLQFADCCDRIIKENAIVEQVRPFGGSFTSILSILIPLRQFICYFACFFFWKIVGVFLKKA